MTDTPHTDKASAAVLAGQTPKDHRKENLSFLKAKQEENKKIVEDQAKPKPDPFKMRKF